MSVTATYRQDMGSVLGAYEHGDTLCRTIVGESSSSTDLALRDVITNT